MSSPAFPVNERELYFEDSYRIDQPIDRIWYIVRDASILGLLNTEKHFPIITKGNVNSWTIGGQFKGYAVGLGEYSGKCLKVKNFPQIKKVKWLIQPESGRSQLYLSFNLYQISNTVSTVLLIKSRIIFRGPFMQNQEIHKSNLSRMVEKVKEILKQSSLNLFQYESAVITASMEDIFRYVDDPIELKKIAPLITFDSSNEKFSSRSTKGDIRVISYNNKRYSYHAKTVLFDKRPNWNKWIFCYDAYGGSPNKIPLQRVLISITKINNHDCYLSIFHDFKEPVSHEVLKELSIKKKYIIHSIKDFLENYK